MGFSFERDIQPGEAIWIDEKGTFHSRICAKGQLSPCIFEYIYLARPDSSLDGISVYASRLKLGENLAKEIKKAIPLDQIDVVMPIPDSARPAAAELAKTLGLEYREGFIKNRYVGRTFIMPGQAIRKKSVRQKLNAMSIEFKDKKVLLVDDSIVRGTTIREIVNMARQSGARKVYVASGAPPVRYPNVYGIDMPTQNELIAGNGKDVETIRQEIGADALVYQTIEGMIDAVKSTGTPIETFDCSCFDGKYVTGDVTPEYLANLEKTAVQRKEAARLEKARQESEEA
jgi:amidophosphoribosyltransferase